MFHAVKDRCFVDFEQLKLPIAPSQAIKILLSKGFAAATIDIVREARFHIGKSAFRLGARMSEMPHVFDCSSFTKWLYGQKGIWIPRFAIQQFDYGTPVDMEDLISGDLIFTSGYSPKAWTIGHVSIFTGTGIISAMINGSGNGIIEMSLEKLIKQRKLYGARRIATRSDYAMTLYVPAHHDIETSDDVKYLVLSHLN